MIKSFSDKNIDHIKKVKKVCDFFTDKRGLLKISKKIGNFSYSFSPKLNHRFLIEFTYIAISYKISAEIYFIFVPSNFFLTDIPQAQPASS